MKLVEDVVSGDNGKIGRAYGREICNINALAPARHAEKLVERVIQDLLLFMRDTCSCRRD